MNEFNTKLSSRTDTKKNAVDEMIEHYRANKITMSPDNVFEIYGKILAEKEAAAAGFDTNQ